MTISDSTFNKDHEVNYHIMMRGGLVWEPLYYEKVDY
jgi:hypothetical protein